LIAVIVVPSSIGAEDIAEDIGMHESTISRVTTK